MVSLSGPQTGRGIPNIAILQIVDASDFSTAAPAVCSNQPVTDDSGIASCDLQLTGQPGNYLISTLVGGFVYTQTIQLTIQAPVACNYGISPTSAAFPSSGGTGTVAVSAGSGCTWTAIPSANWITISSGASGSGSGSVAYTVAANTGVARSASIAVAGQTFSITQAAVTANAPLSFATTSLPPAVVGVSYSALVAATGGQSPYTYLLASGPSGLALNNLTGVLSGTLSTLGTYSVTITVTDVRGASISQTFSLSVVASSGGASPTILANAPPRKAAGEAFSWTFQATGGCISLFNPYAVFTLGAGSGPLPDGLALTTDSSSATGKIAGTPTRDGTYPIVLQVTDSCGHVGTAAYTIIIGAGGGGGGTNNLTASPSQLLFQIQVGTAGTSTQNITVTGSGSFQVVAQMQSGSVSPTWLSVGTSSGTAPSVVTVIANVAGLPIGLYTGSIQIVPTGAVSAIAIPVTLRVQPPPALVPLPTSLYFLYQVGATTGIQTVDVVSNGAALDFAASAATESGGAWLSVTPNRTTTPATLTVTAVGLSLSPGLYKGTVTLTPSLQGVATITIPVTLSIPQSAPLVTSIVNAASFLPGPISPGELVTLFGTNLGPLNLALVQTNAQGRLDTIAGNTRVLFDGVPGPMIYSLTGQVSTIVPYSMAGRSSVKVQVEYKGLVSSSIDVRLADSVPGIFQASATGQAAAVNQDGSINSSDAGADPGSTIAVYATGEGQTDPAGVDGAITGSVLAHPLLPVTAQVNGRDAVVSYAGSAPGLVAGVMQVNVQLPADLPHGTSVSLVITVGKVVSQSGVTIYVK